MKTFFTSDKELLKDSDPRLIAARKAVAKDWRELEKAIRMEDKYASHVGEDTKDLILSNSFKTALRIEKGLEDGNFTFWQRINEKLTGKCVALLGQ